MKYTYEELVKEVGNYGEYPAAHPEKGIEFCNNKLAEFGVTTEKFIEDVKIYRSVYITGP